MKSIEIKIKTLNPIIIAENSGDRNMLNTKNYIPGSSLLGVFAGKYIRENNLGKDAHKNSEFNSHFLKGGLIFSDAFIFDKNRNYPTPLSVRKEKYDDVIFDLIFQEKDFDAQTETFSQFSKLDGGSISKSEVKKEISFHHARNWETQTSQKGVIFNYENIKRNQIFAGNIIGDDEIIDTFYKEFSGKFIAYIGKSKNSQYGKTEIELSNPKKYKWEFKTDIELNSEIVMTCLSDAIVYNKSGFSTTNICDISRELKVKIKKAFMKQNRNEQFVNIWKLKKQSENVILAGSCFLLEKVPENYEDLQKIGFGERMNEGFGQIVFGYQSEDEIRSFDANPVNEKIKPKTEIPEFVINLVKAIVIEKLFEIETGRAMSEASRFVGIPTKSLLGKLQLMSQNINKFKENLEYFKGKPAEKQLIKSHNTKLTLLDYLNKKCMNTEDFGIPSDLDDLLYNVKTELENIEQLKVQLKQKFLETFFNSLRKREVKK